MRTKFILSGDHDLDMLLSANEVGHDSWQILMGCYHQGSCDDDCEFATRFFDLKDYDKAYDYLECCGIEMDDFLDKDGEKNEDRVLLYYLWILSGDIQKFQNEETN